MFNNIKLKISNFKNKQSYFKDKSFIFPEKQSMHYDAVNMDINNTCNQRCRFCFSYFDKNKVYMDVETFEKIIQILPLVRDYQGGGYGLYISCVFEPTVNPQFIEILSKIPKEGKNKCFFTTNLARAMDEEYIKAIINSNIALLNISIESLIPETFHYLTQTKGFYKYKSNLQLLEKVVNEKEGYIPSIRFISMLLKENKDELMDIIDFCFKHFPSEAHEVRTPMIRPMYDNEWNLNQLLSKEEAKKMVDKLNNYPGHIDMNIQSIEDIKESDLKVIPQEKSCEVEKDHYDIAKEKISIVQDYEYLFLRIEPNGTCIDKLTNVPEEIPLDKTEEYFIKKLEHLYKNKAQAVICNNFDDINNIVEGNPNIFIDKFVDNDIFFEVTGWCCPDRDIISDKLILELYGNKGDKHYYYCSIKERTDVDEFYNKERGWSVGFTSYFEKSKLKDDEYVLSLLFRNSLNQNIKYEYENILKIK